MNKQVLFSNESRQKLLSGIKKISDAVRVTMGANGKCVLIADALYNKDGFVVKLPVKVSKDGFTVTKYFSLNDHAENAGAMMIKEAAFKTVEQAGDATTCTCVLAEALISGGMKLIDEGANSQQLKKGMDSALQYVVEELKKISIPVRGNIDRIRQVATISANNDKEIGDLIADAYSKIGDDGVIDIEASQTGKTDIKVFDGFKFDRGWDGMSPFFINKPTKETCELENPLILLYEKQITHHTQFENAFKHVMPTRRPILIICEDAREEGLAVLVTNKMQGNVSVCVVKSPGYGIHRMEAMEDIALLTGATYISDSKGVGIKDMTLAHFGEAKKVIVSAKETVIIGGGGTEGDLNQFVAELRATITNEKTEEEIAHIEKRIARLTGGFAIIQVGAATETELNEKMDRVDDAVRATKAAIAEGFVAGGGTAFLNIHVLYDGAPKDNFTKGWNLLLEAINFPFKQICENSGVDSNEIMDKLLLANKGDYFGYNALTGEIVDMVEAGIIDATKALRCALVNAVSVSGMVLTSECAIITLD